MTTTATAQLDRYRSLLGRAPDSEIAEELGVTVEEVKAYRRAHKINPYLRPAPGVAPRGVSPSPVAEEESSPTELPPAAAVVVGSTGEDAAPVLDAPRATEAPTSPAVQPLDAYRDQLGKVSDDVIAKQAGVKSYLVGEFRRAAGIAAYKGNRFVAGESLRGAPVRDDSPEPAARAVPSGAPGPVAAVRGAPTGGARLDAGTIGARFTLPTAPSGARRGAGTGAVRVVRPTASPRPRTETPAAAPSAPASPAPSSDRTFKNGKLTAFRHLMGVEPDAVVAARAKATAGGVKKFRERHGIAAAPATPSAGKPAAVVVRSSAPAPATGTAPAAGQPAPESIPADRQPRPSKLDAHRDIVGVLTDAAVAAIAGVTRDGVRQFRKRHGIPSTARTQPPETAVVVPAGVNPAEPASEPVAQGTRGEASAPESTTPAAAPPVVESGTEPAAQPAQLSPDVTVPAAPAPVRRFGFRVVAEAGGETRQFIVVGEHIGEAAMAAVQALRAREDGPWTVRFVKVLAEALG